MAFLPRLTQWAVPQAEPTHSQVEQHLAHQRQRDAHDIVRIAVHAHDEGPTQGVNGEAAGHVLWFAGGGIVGDLGIRQVGEVDDRGGHPRLLVCHAIAQHGHIVAGVDHALARTHAVPAHHGLLGGAGLADDIALDLEHGVAGQQHDRFVQQAAFTQLAAHRVALLLGQAGGELVDALIHVGRLVDVGGDGDRSQAGGAQGGKPGGG